MVLDTIFYSQSIISSGLETLINSTSAGLPRSPSLSTALDWGQTNFGNHAASAASNASVSTAPPSLIQQDLYFGLTRANGCPISDAEFQIFIDNVITPRFAAGLTIFDGEGELHKHSTAGDIKVITLYAQGTSENQAAIDQIVKDYRQQFESNVLQVTNEDDLNVGFGVGEDLIDNDPTPELIQVDLFFGRNIGGVEGVSQAQFQTFVDTVITPRFPAGLTNVDANGQFLSSDGQLIREPSEVVSLILEDTQANETAIDEIVAEYIKQFQQESVLIAVNEDITVAFGADDDLIDNDPVPEQIQVDLFFGRNIGGVEGVSEEAFQEFLNHFVDPHFNNFTVLDADGQFLSSTGDLIKERSKEVSFIFEDTQANEAAIKTVISEYIKQFQQESVLIVVDEDINS
ncbi:MAG: DUF3574 domain-containing protein [Leptolyngbyaceae cyanobacterium RU_5_1]|nr:DUF3574 domain-containing protein [Leptolyngbyaceae cyanobacterium RU_5_1]